MTKSKRQCQSGDLCEPRTIAEAIYCMVHHSGMDAEEIAKALIVRKGYLLDAANPDRDEVQFQLRMLVPAMKATGNVSPLRFICREMGGVFVELPEISDSHDAVYRGLCDALEEMGQSSSAVKKALSDDVVTEEEDAVVSQEIDDTISALLRVKAAVKGKVQRPRPQMVAR